MNGHSLTAWAVSSCPGIPCHSSESANFEHWNSVPQSILPKSTVGKATPKSQTSWSECNCASRRQAHPEPKPQLRSVGGSKKSYLRPALSLLREHPTLTEQAGERVSCYPPICPGCPSSDALRLARYISCSSSQHPMLLNLHSVCYSHISSVPPTQFPTLIRPCLGL